MIIDCHGHYTTTPPAVEAYRAQQKDLLKSNPDHLFSKGDISLSDDEIRTIEDKLREYKPRTGLGKKLIDNKYAGILLDTDYLLNELERVAIDPNE